MGPLPLFATPINTPIPKRKEPEEYRDDLRLMTPTNPFEDPFLQGFIDRYDSPTDQRFDTTVDLGQVGLMFKDPRYTLSQMCQDESGLVQQFRV